MAIPASNIVEIIPQVLAGTGTDLVFNGLVLSKSSLLQTGTPQVFSSSSSVGELFGTESEEYIFASIYFQGFTSSDVKPQGLYFYRYTEEAAAPWVQGDAVTPSSALAALKAITAGTFTVTLDGTEYTTTDIDLSSVTSLSEAASAVQTAVQASSEDEVVASLTVTYSSIDNTFTVTSGSAGEEHSITCPTGDVAEAMGFAEDTATISAGADAMSLTETLNTLVKSFQNFVTLTTIWEPSDEEALELASWTATNAEEGTTFLTVIWDSDENNLDSTKTGTIADQLEENNAGYVTVVYPDFKVAAFIMGTAASIDWDAYQGTITFAFKINSGLAASVTDEDSANALIARKVNFIGNYATRNDEFVWLYNGSMFGDWEWIDAYINSIWLCNKLQVQIMSGFESAKRVPYTEAGYALIRSWCRDAIADGVNNGVIDVGVDLSETQKAELITELGADYSDEIYNSGYYLQIEAADADERQARESPPCNLVYTYGGSVHKLSLPVIAVV